MSRFAGRVALITGASRGIGRGCALVLAKEGADVAVNYRSHPEEAEDVAAEIRKMGRRAITLKADVANQAEVENMVAETVKQLGQLNHFVSNAAFSDRKRMIEADMEGFKRTIDVTMWGAFYGVRAAAQQMVKQGKGGSIVVVSSPHAVLAIPTSMAYNMSKVAIDHMARTAAIELVNDRVRVNTIYPGWVDTPGERKFFTEEQIQTGAKKLPWGRLGTPEETAKAIAFMLSDDADYMTGSVLTIDGGVSLPWWSNRDAGEM